MSVPDAWRCMTALRRRAASLQLVHKLALIAVPTGAHVHMGRRHLYLLGVPVDAANPHVAQGRAATGACARCFCRGGFLMVLLYDSHSTTPRRQSQGLARKVSFHSSINPACRSSTAACTPRRSRWPHLEGWRPLRCMRRHKKRLSNSSSLLVAQAAAISRATVRCTLIQLLWLTWPAPLCCCTWPMRTYI